MGVGEELFKAILIMPFAEPTNNVSANIPYICVMNHTGI
jgi:hypothetical protein